MKVLKNVKDSKYDKIFIDLNDDQFCIDLAEKNYQGFKENFKTQMELLQLKSVVCPKA